MTIKGFATMILVDLLLPAAVILNIYLYFYPVLYACAFPRPSASVPAPFRLLTLADPQIEGDTTLRKYDLPPNTRFSPARAGTLIRKYGKMLDLWGNDLYLSHIYHTMRRHTFPTHTTVLGDLLGSQWITDDEFWRRAKRFWRIFGGVRQVSAEEVAGGSALGDGWGEALMLLPGNHDVGYAGDISRPRLVRYEKAFGPYNYVLAFRPPPKEDGNGNGSLTAAVAGEEPELRIAVLNSLTLDTPIWDQSLADETYDFLEALQNTRRKDGGKTQATVLLTHLPLHKPERICVDGPEMKYFPPHYGGGIKSQNFVSEDVSDKLKEMIFGSPTDEEAQGGGGSEGVILTGHDHEGCQSVHFWEKEKNAWNVMTYKKWIDGRREEEKKKGEPKTVREITVRSMMGEFGGNAGLFSAWFDYDLNGMPLTPLSSFARETY